ncbi:nucleotidyl transferase AbiEii/AbiGii toxin family protein [Collinsella sp. AGMB00827]|uniref:Nucleotidyl transferase AbiEii/AbiGii toxin family protein n=1 Tax=Collinsella ureilytica TaxID=2869515 RepID=A0ABS7MJ95_9ACTN|nr:nucleotidyl transferase AbiEii/AbiGii toxin family protein [Collinsella urealyticum]MBY4797445.1 nucleotidyl transferase AbiEii/AbiGii toxin family protein [Collinsella urealyticum]
MRYKTPAALEMAVKAAARAVRMDTSRAITGFYFHRLLCRIFNDPARRFVLKGGQSMLARTVDARATRDIDLVYRERSLDAALKDLTKLASQDIGDYMTFIFTSATPIKLDDEYRSGLSVTFQPMLGARPLQLISIDLVVDEVPLECVETITPADRLAIEGLMECDYLVYPVEVALADKMCALIEMHDGRPSSRVKDLVDIVIYAITCRVDGRMLEERMKREAAVRKITLPNTFGIPEEWVGSRERQFTKLCSQTGLIGISTIADAMDLASKLLDPVLTAAAEGMVWNPDAAKWEAKADRTC